MLSGSRQGMYCDVHCLCGWGPWEGDELPTVEFLRPTDPTSEQTDSSDASA